MALLLPSAAMGQNIEFPEVPFECGPVDWEQIGFQVQPGGQELGLLFDAVGDCEGYRASDGDSHGVFVVVLGPGSWTFVYLFEMTMPAGVSDLSHMWARADQSLFGPFLGPSACYARAETLNLDAGGFHTLFEIPSGTGEVNEKFIFSLTEGIEPGDRFTLRFTVNDKDMTDGIECPLAFLADQVLEDLGAIPVANEDGPTVELPQSTTLRPAYPNPFNPSTTIPFELAEAGEATLAVFDGLGRYVGTLTSGYKSAGRHEVAFEAESLPSGVYVYQLKANGAVRHGSVTLVR
ncbi:MAG: T9SS type A sorting domain-containing protein [Bacteroidetes bacterium]|nr:T9SS type A sorting domain-containing protein [Bacteroidota bacterium]